MTDYIYPTNKTGQAKQVPAHIVKNMGRSGYVCLCGTVFEFNKAWRIFTERQNLRAICWDCERIEREIHNPELEKLKKWKEAVNG